MTTGERLVAEARKQRDSKVARDDLIRQRRAEGAPLRAIAAEAGLSVRAIELIVRKS